MIDKHQCRATIMTNLIYSCDFWLNNIRFIEIVPKWYHVMRWNLNYRCSNNFGHFQLSENYWQLVIVKPTFPQLDQRKYCFLTQKKNTYRSVVLTLPVRSENSFNSLDRKSSRRRSPCFAAAKISSWKHEMQLR